MGRELKRVPLDFNYPLNTVWEGYSPNIEKFKSIKDIFTKAPYLKECNSSCDICTKCNKTMDCCNENADHCVWYNEDIKAEWFYEVPKGDGYQLWEDTTEGSPISPVFTTLEGLCEWCEKNAYTFADFKATKEEWFRMLNDNRVYHEQGNCIFI